MGHAIRHPAANFTFGPPPGESERVGSVDCFITLDPAKTRMTSVTTCWQFTPEEIDEICQTGQVMVHFLGGGLMAHFVAPESVMRTFVLDYGRSW